MRRSGRRPGRRPSQRCAATCAAEVGAASCLRRPFTARSKRKRTRRRRNRGGNTVGRRKPREPGRLHHVYLLPSVPHRIASRMDHKRGGYVLGTGWQLEQVDVQYEVTC
jgi:hypothetical protein